MSILTSADQAAYDTLLNQLHTLGFRDQDTAGLQALADNLGLSSPGCPYTVLAYLTFHSVHAVIEQNDHTDTDEAGRRTVVLNPPVLLLESSHGRLALPVDAEAELLAEVLGHLSR